MKLLIIEDNPDLAKVTRDLLLMCDQQIPPCERRFTAIHIVPDQMTALKLLPSYDAVLCDGEFLGGPTSTCTGAWWAGIAEECRRLWIPCVVYSGSAKVLEGALRGGVAALTKPTAGNVLYAVIVAVHDSLSSLRSMFAGPKVTGEREQVTATAA